MLAEHMSQKYHIRMLIFALMERPGIKQKGACCYRQIAIDAEGCNHPKVPKTPQFIVFYSTHTTMIIHLQLYLMLWNIHDTS